MKLLLSSFFLLIVISFTNAQVENRPVKKTDDGAMDRIIVLQKDVQLQKTQIKELQAQVSTMQPLLQTQELQLKKLQAQVQNIQPLIQSQITNLQGQIQALTKQLQDAQAVKNTAFEEAKKDIGAAKIGIAIFSNALDQLKKRFDSQVGDWRISGFIMSNSLAPNSTAKLLMGDKVPD